MFRWNQSPFFPIRRLRLAVFSIILANFFSTDGGMSTESIECITPLAPIASGPVTVAFPPIVTAPIDSQLQALTKF